MAGRASRRRRVGDITDSEIAALPNAHVETFSSSDEQIKDLFTVESEEGSDKQQQAGQSTVTSAEDKQVGGHKNVTAELLNNIEAMQRDRSERMEKRKKRDEQVRMERERRDQQVRIDSEKRT
jgi:hypothetical protein